MHPRRAIRAVALRVHRLDGPEKNCVRLVAPGRSSAQPRVAAASGNVQHAAHRGHPVHGLVRPHESEGFGSVIDSRANQTAAFPRISRSSLSCLFSRRSSRSSRRSAVLRPSALRPSSMSDWVAHFRIVLGDGSNSFASSYGLRPARTNSTIRRLNSDGYVFFPFAMRTPPLPQKWGVH